MRITTISCLYYFDSSSVVNIADWESAAAAKSGNGVAVNQCIM